MRAVVQRWGNSLAVRIPRAFAEETCLKQGTEIDMSLSEGKVILAPTSSHTPRLADLLRRVTPENTHSEVDWGIPMGKEIW
ncbi:MAG: AbrB/MazE/SpoVT family DNA-binding domain-containing protein [Candidatus Riflebacteria bacterium]|nr:AbrB/MazE/SpoVT family DNA-binding domain-containing protein [Candidatus Riflebacteria bacterium]